MVLIHCSIILSAFFKVEDCHTAEVVTTLKGTTFRVAESSPDMYASVDAVADRLVSISGLYSAEI
jgi:ribosome-associated translation inhibitor RaiA